MTDGHEQIAAHLNTLARYLALDDFGGAQPSQEELRSAGVIVLFGNQVVQTLTRACTLAQMAPQTKLLFSGGIGHSTRLLFENLCRDPHFATQSALTENMAEAEMYAAAAQSVFSIPAHRIVVETQSTNGGENAQFSIRALQDIGLSRETVLLLQDPTMQRRSVLTWERHAESAGFEGRLVSHSALVPHVEVATDGTIRIRRDQAEGSWSIARLVALLLGEIRRLRDDENGYGPRGQNFIPHVDIPDAVLESYARLRANNFVMSMGEARG